MSNSHYSDIVSIQSSHVFELSGRLLKTDCWAPLLHF